MDLLFNDLSIHGQFHDVGSFHQAFERLMVMRDVAKRFGRDVYCNSNLVSTSPGQRFSMQQAINQLRDRNKCRAVMCWLTKGPFWDTSEQRKHGENDLLECVNENHRVVTDTAVGEAAFRMLGDFPCKIVSITPSDWQLTPLDVIYWNDDGESESQCVKIKNVIDSNALERELQNAESPVSSSNTLRKTSSARFTRLMFAENCFEPLTSIPFKGSVAESLLKLLNILNQLALEVDLNGKRTAKGERIHDQYFKHKNALFSDSSDSEKNDFKSNLTFHHPDNPHEQLFCPYHGKVSALKKELTIRLHFS